MLFILAPSMVTMNSRAGKFVSFEFPGRKREAARESDSGEDIFTAMVNSYARKSTASIQRLIEAEVKYMHTLACPDLAPYGKDEMLGALFMLTMLSGNMERILAGESINVEWREVFRLLFFNAVSPERIVKNAMREERRKQTLDTTNYIKSILKGNGSITAQSLKRLMGKKEQKTLDSFLNKRTE
jgi:hypothetical protein